MRRVGERGGIVALGGGERVVQCRPAFVLFVVVEHGEIHHPDRTPAVLHQTEIFTHFDAQGTQCIVDHFGFVGAEEDQVAGLSAGTADQLLDNLVGQEFQNWRLQAVASGGHIIHFYIGETFGTVDANVIGITVDILAR